MCKVCVFAGTTEGREIVELLSNAGVTVYACAATEYGGTLLQESANVTVSARRLTQQEMEALFRQEQFSLVVDATHPYAPLATAHIQAACQSVGLAYERLLREEDAVPEDAIFVHSTIEAVERLRTLPGKILLTTGSKELAAYSVLPDFAQRVYARVLPVESSIQACREAGLPAANIIAMQGPFSQELNTAMLRSVGASILVTKESGTKGGFPEKAAAAAAAGARLLVIGRPPQVAGMSFGALAAKLAAQLGFSLPRQVAIVGIGPGSPGERTLDAAETIAQADCLIGARRMLDAVSHPGQLCCEAIAPEEIRKFIDSHPECRKIAVVMAGDVGFFSGAKKLLPLLSDCAPRLIPGISSLVALCARLGVSYEDATIVSLHGRAGNVPAALARTGKVFALVGGSSGMADLCRELSDSGFGKAHVAVGQRLGYPDEEITQGTAEELMHCRFHPLSVALITHAPTAVVTHGLEDSLFLRGSHADGSVVPMTKREVRASALSHLELTSGAMCWDVGAGTGSVAIEMALQCPAGKVYAIEKKPDAMSLLSENCRAFHVPNVTIVPGTAPESCRELPAPTHVFIGGSSGNIQAILSLALEKNPAVRIVAAAIALETVAELTRCAASLPFASWDVVSITAAQGRKAGPYHLMQGQNPVYIFTFQG